MMENNFSNAIGWMPPELTVPILLLKGLFAVSGVVLLIWHMDRCWRAMENSAQRARYILLLAYGVLQVGSVAELLVEGVELSYRHLGALACSLGLVVVAIWSIRHDQPCQPAHNNNTEGASNASQ